jgi:hypothetical protein
MDRALKTPKAALEAIRDTTMNAFSADRAVAGGIFDALEMQTEPVSKAFHEARFIGRRWQMPSLQKHRVQTYSVRSNSTANNSGFDQ